MRVDPGDRSLERLGEGDIGVTVDVDGVLKVAFGDTEGPRLVDPGQLSSIEGVQAMTIHKSQGSQFRLVIILVPGKESRLLTRELLYTAVTRAEQHVTVIGSEPAIRDAVNRPVVRASGLRAREVYPEVVDDGSWFGRDVPS